jgi:hypothetical protein
MARTKQIARKSTGGKVSAKESRISGPFCPSPQGANPPPTLWEESHVGAPFVGGPRGPLVPLPPLSIGRVVPLPPLSLGREKGPARPSRALASSVDWKGRALDLCCRLEGSWRGTERTTFSPWRPHTHRRPPASSSPPRPPAKWRWPAAASRRPATGFVRAPRRSERFASIRRAPRCSSASCRFSASSARLPRYGPARQSCSLIASLHWRMPSLDLCSARFASAWERRLLCRALILTTGLQGGPALPGTIPDLVHSSPCAPRTSALAPASAQGRYRPATRVPPLLRCRRRRRRTS